MLNFLNKSEPDERGSVQVVMVVCDDCLSILTGWAGKDYFLSLAGFLIFLYLWLFISDRSSMVTIKYKFGKMLKFVTGFVCGFSFFFLLD